MVQLKIANIMLYVFYRSGKIVKLKNILKVGDIMDGP